MRTYLDDLVDEEFRTEGWHSSMKFAARRVAQRAFAHGAEQTCAAMSLMVGPASEAQPAPADEKPYWIKFDGGTATRMDERRSRDRREK